MASPVRGLRPLRALRVVFKNVPKTYQRYFAIFFSLSALPIPSMKELQSRASGCLGNSCIQSHLVNQF